MPSIDSTNKNFLEKAFSEFENNIQKIQVLSAQVPIPSKDLQRVQNKNAKMVQHLRQLALHPDDDIRRQANDLLIKVTLKQLQTKAFAMPMPTIPAAPQSPSASLPMPPLPSLPSAQPVVNTQPRIEPAKQATSALQNQKREKKSFFKKIVSQFKKSFEDYGNATENASKRINIIINKSSNSSSLKIKKAELDELYGISKNQSANDAIDKILDHYSQTRMQIMQQIEKQLNDKMVEFTANIVQGKMSLADAKSELNKLAEDLTKDNKDKIITAIKEDRRANLAIFEYKLIDSVLKDGKINKKQAMKKVNEAQKVYSSYTAESEKSDFEFMQKRVKITVDSLETKLATEVKKQSSQQLTSLPPVAESLRGNGQGFVLDMPEEHAVTNNNQVSAAAAIQYENPRTLLFRSPPPSTPSPDKEIKADAEADAKSRNIPKNK